MPAGSFPIDIVLFAIIAAFLVLRLRGILGRRTGFEPQAPARGRAAQAGPTIEGRAEAPPARPVRPLPEPSSPAGLDLQRLRDAERSFDPARFLDGAEQAFRMIVTGYAGGDRVTLRSLLTDDTYRTFETAIAAREAAGETQRTELRQVTDATITEASLRPEGSRRLAEITVRFASDQVNVTLDRAGRPVSGIDAVTEIVDIWTFERELAASDPAWRLAAARSG